LCSGKGEISGKFFFGNMNLGMFERFCPILKTRAQLEERKFDLNKFDRNSERYVIPMHRNNFWTKKWMQDPRENFCILQVHRYDPSAQYKKVGDRLKERED
jgi:hypothetical protein